MQPRAVFGIVVRSFGLMSLVYAIWNIGFAFSDAMGYAARADAMLRDYVTSVATFVAMGVTLLRGADVIVAFAYGPDWRNQHAASPAEPEN